MRNCTFVLHYKVESLNVIALTPGKNEITYTLLL